MSRSRKKVAVTGFTTARSEKQDKRNLNRRLRRIVKAKLTRQDREDAIFPVPDEILDVWSMAKDGKQWFKKADLPSCHDCAQRIRCVTDEEYRNYCSAVWRYKWYQKALRK